MTAIEDAGRAHICTHCGAGNRSAARFCEKCVMPLGAVHSAIGQQTELATPAASRDAPWKAHEDEAGASATIRRHAMLDFGARALPDGMVIEGFRLEHPLGEGGFGIVYLAWDGALERHVAIKEYMPASLTVRAAGATAVSLRSEHDRPTFDAGLRSFVNEARLLARFDHPSLVKVLRFWEANGTAYMAMPYYEGPTLKASLAAAAHPVSEAQLRSWIEPLLDALSVLHSENCYHRDVAPDNILLTGSGPVLLDFGAARRVITDRTQMLTTMLKPGFAPIEQYGSEMMQGPWTDLYALGGVVHYAITGRPPVPSVVRVVNDLQPRLSVTQASRFSARFLAAMDAALSVMPEARPQDVSQFRASLEDAAGAQVPEPTALSAAPAAVASASALAASDPLLEREPKEEVSRSATPSGPATQPPTSIPPALSRPLRWTRAMMPKVRARVGRPRLAYVAAGGLAVLLLAARAWWPTAVEATSPTARSAPAAQPMPTAPSHATSTPGLAPAQGAQARLDAVSMPATPVRPDALPPAHATIAPGAASPAVPAVSPVPAIVSSMRPPGPVAAARSSPRSSTPPVAQRRPSDTADASVASNGSNAYKDSGKPPGCADLVLKASLQPLTPDEKSFLRATCR